MEIAEDWPGERPDNVMEGGEGRMIEKKKIRREVGG